MPFPGKRPTSEDVEPEQPERYFATEEEKRQDWRLLSLIRAAAEHKEPLEAGDIPLLARVADSTSDLHEACNALRGGCTIPRLVDIFT